MSGFTVYVLLSKSISTTKDGGVNIKIHTNELTDEEKLAIMKYAGSAGWILFRETEVNESEIPEPPIEDISKPIHIRIRNACYVLIESKKKSKPTPKEVHDIYHLFMDNLLDEIKDKIDNYKSWKSTNQGYQN